MTVPIQYGILQQPAMDPVFPIPGSEVPEIGLIGVALRFVVAQQNGSHLSQDCHEDGHGDSEMTPKQSSDDFLEGLSVPKSPPVPIDPVIQEDVDSQQDPILDPLILERAQHEISRKNIDRDALNALYRLIDNGHIAYLVGGAVRDLMLGRKPKDFDIVTDATPRKVKRLFRNCRIIGRRFRLAHLHYAGGKIIEVATFRSSGRADQVIRDGEMIRRDNVYGTPDEDAHRRDLTVNGLFYDVSSFRVIDYVGGVNDLRSRVIRMIGDPHQSFREDPIRMLRAIRHSVRIDFQFDQKTQGAMEQSREEILKANPARLLEELYKDLASGHARKFFSVLHRDGFLELLMPALTKVLVQDEKRNEWTAGLERLDGQRVEGHKIHQALGIAALVTPMLLPRVRKLQRGSTRDPRTISQKFRDDLAEAFQQLKVYRRDEERLWAALGGLRAVADAVDEGQWSTKLTARPWFHDSMEILYVLLGPGQRRREMLDLSREIPRPEPAEGLPGRRRRRKKKAGDGPQGVARGSEGGGPGASSGAMGVSRRRRRKPSRTPGSRRPPPGGQTA
ncbi:MAG: polynucleotide adenylyltransferase PcnB [Planctomycetota bacterium]